MNAIIGLCHFCEAHGPRAVFCTYATKDPKPQEPLKHSTVCSACTSIGPDIILQSKDENGLIFCGRESVPNGDVTALLRQAAVRSITCEVSWSKEGGVVYFGDSRGYVLSFTFQLKDSRARGLKRWFSVVVLMRDKMLLLNVMPSLSEHMKKIAKNLQQLADTVYEEEQKICSQRALRLNTGRNDFGPSRSLIQLTGDNNIFKTLHVHFVWMIKSSALSYTETLYTSKDLLEKLNNGLLEWDISNGNSLIEEPLEAIPIRILNEMMYRNMFRILLFCTLTGYKIFVKTDNSVQNSAIVKTLMGLLPIKDCEIPDYTISTIEDTSKSESLCILEGKENLTCRWSGNLPNKCPRLLTLIESAIDNSKFKDSVLELHIKSLQLEWLGIARTLKSAIQSSKPTSEPVVKLKQVLGVAAHDEILVNHWMKTFCT